MKYYRVDSTNDYIICWKYEGESEECGIIHRTVYRDCDMDTVKEKFIAENPDLVIVDIYKMRDLSDFYGEY